MKKKIEFTQEQIETMIDMHNKGILNKDIAKKFNTSLSTINRRLAENGVISRHPLLTKERVQMVIDLYKEFQRINTYFKSLENSTCLPIQYARIDADVFKQKYLELLMKYLV